MDTSIWDDVSDPQLRALLRGAAAETDPEYPRTALPVPELAPNETYAADFVLAGASVIRTGHAADLNTFAERTGLGVLNAFTAKGLFRWDSPYHLGTGCLQQRDLALAGAGPDSRVLVVGVDTDECRPPLLAAAGVSETPDTWRSVQPADLLSAAERVSPTWGAPPQKPPQPELFHALWNVAQPLYALDQAPLNPARAAADVATALGAAGVVCAEPGQAGWWIGRTVPTTRLGSVAIPAAARPGAAVARALLTAHSGAPALAVVDQPLNASAAALIDLGRQRELSFVVEIWGDAGERLDAETHRQRASAALAADGVTVIELAIDFSPTAQLEAAAGPLVAWS